MPARRVTTVTVPVQVRSGVAFEAYRDRTPLLTIWATRPALLVTLTLPERIEPGHVRFARQLAVSAAAYASEVERRYLALLRAPAAQGGDRVITSDAYVRFSPDGPAEVDASLRLSVARSSTATPTRLTPPILSVRDRHVSVSVTVPDRHKVTPR